MTKIINDPKFLGLPDAEKLQVRGLVCVVCVCQWVGGWVGYLKRWGLRGLGVGGRGTLQ